MPLAATGMILPLGGGGVCCGDAVQAWGVEAGYGGIERKLLLCGIDDGGDKCAFCEFRG